MDRLLSMKVFQRVVDEGSFAAAARVLDMSAPVVTRLVADLEDHLGSRLLQRSTRRLALTDAGQLYLNRVRNILQDIEEADELASAHTQELGGLLRLHATPVLATYVVAPVLAGFRERYPNIQIDLEVETLREPPVEDFDITLITADDSFDANLVARKIIEANAILVASPAYVQRRGVPQTPADLAQHDCLRHKTPNGRHRHWRMWHEREPGLTEEVEARPMLLTNHPDTLLRAALDGAGITEVTMEMVTSYLMRGELVRVLQPWITVRLGIYAALPSRKFIPQRSRVFLDHLMECTREKSLRALEACTVC